MNYRFIYGGNYHLTIPAVVIDARVKLGLAGKIGDEIKAYADAQLAKVVSDCIPFKIETDSGVLVGNLVLKKNNFGKSASVLQLVLRSNFQQFADDINMQVIDFVSGGDWIFEIL